MIIWWLDAKEVVPSFSFIAFFFGTESCIVFLLSCGVVTLLTAYIQQAYSVISFDLNV